MTGEGAAGPGGAAGTGRATRDRGHPHTHSFCCSPGRAETSGVAGGALRRHRQRQRERGPAGRRRLSTAGRTAPAAAARSCRGRSGQPPSNGEAWAKGGRVLPGSRAGPSASLPQGEQRGVPSPPVSLAPPVPGPCRCSRPAGSGTRGLAVGWGAFNPGAARSFHVSRFHANPVPLPFPPP